MGPDAVCVQRRPWSACAIAQADLGLRCPLTQSMESVVYVDEQKLSIGQIASTQTLILTFAVRHWHKHLFPTLHINYRIYPPYSDRQARANDEDAALCCVSSMSILFDQTCLSKYLNKRQVVVSVKNLFWACAVNVLKFEILCAILFLPKFYFYALIPYKYFLEKQRYTPW